MPSLPPNRTRIQKRQRQEEEDAGSSLSEHDSREFDDATLARNDPHHQVGMPEEKRKKSREDKELWSYALKKPPKGLPERGNSNQELFYYKRCTPKAFSSATHFRRHLKGRHGIYVESKRSEVDIKAKATLGALFKKQAEKQAKEPDLKATKILKELVNKHAFFDALCYLIVTQNLPHTIVEWPEFRAFLHVCNYTLTSEGGLLYKSRRSVPLLIGKTFVVHKEMIKGKLKKALSKLHFTTDCWTSPNKKAYQAITVHFVDEFGQMSKATLALREHKEEHGGEQQAEVLLKVIDEYEIKESQIGYITGKL